MIRLESLQKNDSEKSELIMEIQIKKVITCLKRNLKTRMTVL